MKIIRGLHNLNQHQGCAVTIGNFDGVHVGHQQIIGALVKKAKTLTLPSVLISFAPTPQFFFGKAHATLNSFKEKYKLLAALGLDEHLVVHFNQAFSQLCAEDFVRQVLVKKLQVKYCLIGDDFRFGKERQGDFALLQNFGFVVEKTNSVFCGADRISSSKIRILLKQGRFDLAEKMLGRAFAISGMIVSGQRLGRTIGFPTINIPIKHNISPILGVFAVEVVLQNSPYQGVCNIGKRPTVGGEKPWLEVFLFDFNQQVYRQTAKVVFKHKLRDEQKFESLDALKAQIQADVKAAQDCFND